MNWDKYSDAPNTADKNSSAVAALACSACRVIGQTVEHTPIEPGQEFGPNQAHAEVCGDKSKTIRHQLRDLAKIVWLKQ